MCWQDLGNQKRVMMYSEASKRQAVSLSAGSRARGGNSDKNREGNLLCEVGCVRGAVAFSWGPRPTHVEHISLTFFLLWNLLPVPPIGTYRKLEGGGFLGCKTLWVSLPGHRIGWRKKVDRQTEVGGSVSSGWINELLLTTFLNG